MAPQYPQQGYAPPPGYAPQGVPPGYAATPQTGMPAAPYPQAARQAQRAPQRPRNTAPARPAIDLSKCEEPDEPVRAQGRNGGMVTLGFAVLAVISLVAFYLYTAHVKRVPAEL